MEGNFSERGGSRKGERSKLIPAVGKTSLFSSLLSLLLLFHSQVIKFLSATAMRNADAEEEPARSPVVAERRRQAND